MGDENGQIDIFTEDGNLEDFFSGDEDMDDLLDPQRDSLNDELIHLPIRIKCPYSPREIGDYLLNLKSMTNQFEIKYEEFLKTERIKKEEEKMKKIKIKSTKMKEEKVPKL